MTHQLQLDPRLAQRWDDSGNLVVFRFEEPYDSVCLSRDTGLLAQLFAGPDGADVGEAATRFARLAGEGHEARMRTSVLEGIEQLRRAGILVERPPEISRYDATMAPFYREHRATPAAIAEIIVREAKIGRGTRILDLGAGTGSLAIQLSRWSDEVVGIDASDELLDVALTDARAAGSSASFVKGSANDLVFSTKRYDVIVVSQAFHWFDPSLVAHGFYRALAEGGSLFLVETKYELPAANPLRSMMGIGAPSWRSIPAQCEEHARRYEALFEHVRRKPPALRLRAFEILREERAFDLGFAKAFLFADNLAASGDRERPWAKLEAATREADPTSLMGTMHWFVAKYQRDTGRRVEHMAGLRDAKCVAPRRVMG